MNTTKNTIHVLPPEVVDQIAAGEVLERPAHMVKELVENAIDAGATEVRVQFEKGGRYVQVSDNGRGMQKHELALALSRHATSKISSSDELWSLSSFGFRGEALASIASVSRVVLRSRTQHENGVAQNETTEHAHAQEAEPSSQQEVKQEQNQASASAWQLDAQFGKIQAPHPVGGELGTRIIVDELFANTPARLKFLKSDTAESVQIKDVLKAMALSHPQVSFYIKSNKELIFCWPQANFIERAKQVLEVKELHENQYTYEGVQARALLAPPHITARTRRQMWCFVHNRFVQDKTMQAAVLDAYRNLLMHREYPVGVFFLRLPDGEVDVNIHPTKSQVKFRSTQNVFRALNRCVREKLEQAPWLKRLLHNTPEPAQAAPNGPAPNRPTPNVPTPNGPTPSRPADWRNTTAWGQMQQAASSSSALSSAGSGAADADVDIANSTIAPGEVGTHNAIGTPGEADASSEISECSESIQPNEAKPIVNYADAWQEGEAAPKPKQEALIFEDAANAQSQWGQLRALAQLQRTYIVCQTSKAMILIDQHAACERVLFERLWHSWRDKKIKSQYKMIPLSLKMSAEKVESLLKNKNKLSEMGLLIEAVGPENIDITGTPAGVKESVVPQVVESLASDMLKYGTSFAFEHVISDILATMACHSAVRAGQELSVDEMQELLHQMDEHPLSSFCPHGRPVFVEIPFSQLERDFGRKV